MDHFVSVKKELQVNKVNIRTKKGNKARKNRTLNPGEKLKVIDRYKSKGLATHGEKCITVIDEQGYKYNLFASDTIKYAKGYRVSFKREITEYHHIDVQATSKEEAAAKARNLVREDKGLNVLDDSVFEKDHKFEAEQR